MFRLDWIRGYIRLGGGFKPRKKMIKKQKIVEKRWTKKKLSSSVKRENHPRNDFFRPSFFNDFSFFNHLFPRLKSSLVDGIGWESHLYIALHYPLQQNSWLAIQSFQSSENIRMISDSKFWIPAPLIRTFWISHSHPIFIS